MTDTKTLWQELVAAGRGVVALILGDRRAPGWFDLTPRGLIGSFIAVLVVTGINAYLPVLLRVPGAAGTVFESVVVIGVLLALQVGFAAIVLRQLKRPDGLVPYLVAYNWANVFLTLGTLVLALTGLGGELLLVAVGIVVIVVTVNIARLIVTLTPLQIVMFLIAQLVGGSIGLIFVGLLFGPGPEAALTGT